MRPLARRRRGWVKRLALIALSILALLTVCALAQRAYLVHLGDQQLAAVEAELDESEPGWRWDDIQARREVIPEAENSAAIILRAAELLPPHWPEKPAAPPEGRPAQPPGTESLPTLQDRLDDAEPVSILDTDLAAELRAELVALAPALTEARKIINRPKGRYHIAYTKDFLSTPLDHVQQARRCAYLLGFDATARAAEKDYDGGLASARGVLQAGRSNGDEPVIIPQLVRMACDAQAVRNMERVLAQGQVSQEALRSTSALLADEASQNFCLMAARGERAAAPGILRSFYTGELDLEQFTLGRYKPSRRTNLIGWLYQRPVMHMADAAALHYLTRLVHAAQLAADERRKEALAVDQEIRNIKASKNYGLISAVLLVPQVIRLVETQDCTHAGLRCAQVGTALEGYRLSHDGRPVSKWTDPDDAFLDVAKAIRAAAKQKSDNMGGSSPQPARIAAPPAGPRSSNLRMRKTFTERDRDCFLDETFEFMARFFENSLVELEARNPGIETAFKRIDATRFAASIYRNGTALARCQIIASCAANESFF